MTEPVTEAKLRNLDTRTTRLEDAVRRLEASSKTTWFTDSEREAITVLFWVSLIVWGVVSNHRKKVRP